MSQEISASVTLNAANGSLVINKTASIKIDMAGKHYNAIAQTIPTTAGGTALSINAGVATLGVTWLRNTDGTNYIDIGVVVSATFYPSLRLKAGEMQLVRFVPGVTYYGLANTASVILEHMELED